MILGGVESLVALRETGGHAVSAISVHLVGPVGMGRTHVAGCSMVVALLDEADLLRFALALHWDVVNHIYAAIDKLLFREEALED